MNPYQICGYLDLSSLSFRRLPVYCNDDCSKFVVTCSTFKYIRFAIPYYGYSPNVISRVSDLWLFRYTPLEQPLEISCNRDVHNICTLGHFLMAFPMVGQGFSVLYFSPLANLSRWKHCNENGTLDSSSYS